MSQLPMQMPEANLKPDTFGGGVFHGEAEDAPNRRPASVEKYDAIGPSSGQQFQQTNVRSYSDTKLNE